VITKDAPAKNTFTHDLNTQSRHLLPPLLYLEQKKNTLHVACILLLFISDLTDFQKTWYKRYKR